MAERFSAVVDFAGIGDISDAAVRDILERVFELHLAHTPHRRFHLTPNALVLLFDKPAIRTVQRTLHVLDQELNVLPHGRAAWRIFDLRTDQHYFRSVCHRLLDDAAHRAGHVVRPGRSESDRQAAFLNVMDQLRTLDPTVYMHRQNVIRFVDDKPARIEFEEVWLGIEMLERSLDLRIHEDPRKFLLMTEMLDFKVLHHLARPENAGPRVSLNFHAENVLLPQFDDIATEIEAARRPDVIFELPLSDFHAQPRHFRSACAKLEGLGFRLAIDHVNWPEWEAAAQDLPRADYTKILWDARLARLPAQARAKAASSIEAGSSRFVLIHCGDSQSVQHGRSLGFRLLQGRAVPEIPAPPKPPLRIVVLNPVEPPPEPQPGGESKIPSV